MSISPQLGGEHRVEIPAGAISHRACSNGLPIVFVHGVGVNGDLWRRLAGIGKAGHPDLRVVVELPGIEPVRPPGNMPSDLRFSSVSVRFVSVRYLRFRSRVLTPSRAD